MKFWYTCPVGGCGDEWGGGGGTERGNICKFECQFYNLKASTNADEIN